MEKTKIFLFESKHSVAENMDKRLENLGYSVTKLLTSREEAIKNVKEKIPDLVIINSNLQDDMDEVEAANHIRSSFNSPIIYLTTHEDKKTLDQTIKDSFEYINKPFEDRELQSTIEVSLYKNKVEELQNKLDKQREKFVSILSHDLKGSLIPVIAFNKRLIDGKAKSEEDKLRILKIIQKCSRKLSQAIESMSHSMKKKSALQSFNPQKVEFNDIILKVIKNDMPDIENKEIEVFINNKSRVDWNKLEKVTFNADPSQLKILVENLIGNAITYSKKTIKIELNKNSSDIRFVISDDGLGIPKKYQVKIFEEYFQVPGSKIGMGVGLYNVKKVVENHQGKIFVHSSLSKGSSFEITFPCNSSLCIN